MDYFKFDLQLFADYDFGTTAAGDAYLDNNGDWQTDAETAASNEPIKAMIVGNAITVTADTAVSIKAGTNIGLAGKTILLADSISNDGQAVNTSAGTAATVTLKDNSGSTLAVISGVKNGTSASTITVDSTSAEKVTVTAGCTVGNLKATGSGMTVVYNATPAEVELISGSASLTENTATKIKGSTVTAPEGGAAISRENDVVTISTVGCVLDTNALTTAGAEVKVTVGNAANDLALTAGKVTVPQNGTVTTTNGVQVTAPDTGESTVTVDEDNTKLTVSEGCVVAGMTATDGEITVADNSTNTSLLDGKVTVTQSATVKAGTNNNAFVAPSDTGSYTVQVSGTTATVSAGFVVNNMTAKNDSTVFTLAATDATVSLATGTVTVASGAQFVVGDGTYTNSGTGNADYTATTGGVLVGQNVEITASGASNEIVNSSETEKTITVSADGAVIAAETGAKFTVNSKTFIATAAGVTEADSSAVGVYTGTWGASGLNVTNAGAVSAGGTLLQPLTLVLDETSATTKDDGSALPTYYAVNAAGAVGTVTTDKPTTGDNVIGYFKVVTDYNSGAPKVTVTFVTDSNTESNNPHAYAGKVSVNAEAIAEITNANTGEAASLKTLDVVTTQSLSASTADDKITVSNLVTGATADLDEQYITRLAAVTGIDLTDVASVLKMADAVRYYAVDTDGTGKWFGDTTSATAYGTLKGMLENKTLTFAVGTESPKVTLIGSQAAADMDGVSIELKTTLTAGASSVTKGSNVAGLVTLAGSSVRGMEIGLTSGGTIAFENNTAVGLIAKVPTGTTVTGKSNVVTATTESVFKVDKVVPTLIDGTVDVANGQKVIVGGNTYTSAGGASTTARVSATATKTDGVITAEAVAGTLTAGASTASKVTTGAGEAIIANGATITVPSATAVVSSTGAITGLKHTDSFTVGDVTYTVKGTVNTDAQLIASGAYTGAYVLTSVSATDVAESVTVTALAGGKVTVTDQKQAGATKTVTELKLGDNILVLSPESGEEYLTKDKSYYYKVTVGTGELQVAAATDLADAKNGSIGYFEVVATNNDSKPTLEVVFYANDNATVGETGTVSQLLSGVTIQIGDADGDGLIKSVEDSGTETPLQYVNVSGIATGTVALKNIPSTVEANVTGTTTVPANADYQTTDRLASTTLLTLTGATTTKYYEIDATATGSYGYRNYTFKAAADGQPTGASYKVTYNSGTYTVEFDAGSSGAPSPTAADFDGLKISAANLDTSSVVVIKPTGTETYDVTAKRGTEIQVDNAAHLAQVTPHWTGTTPADQITYKEDPSDLTKTVSKITIPKTDEDTTYYYKVTGGPGLTSLGTGVANLTIQQVTSEPTWTSDNDSYIVVAIDVDGGTDGAAAATITYRQGEKTETALPRPALYGLTTKVAFDLSALPAGSTITQATPTVKRPLRNAADMDMALTVPANAVLVGHDENDTITYGTAYVNAAEIDLSSLATLDNGNYYFLATAGTPDAKGLATVTVGSYVAGTPAATLNAFTVTKTGGSYVVGYQAGVGGTQTISGFASGKAKLLVGGNSTITSITTSDTKANYVLNQGTYDLATLSVNVDATDTDSYVKTYAWASGASLDLNGVSSSDIVFSITTTDLRGKKTFAAASGATAGATLTTITAHWDNTAKSITLSISVDGSNTDAAKRADIAKIVGKLGVMTSTTWPTGLAKIVLTDDAGGVIHYNVTGVPAGVNVDNQGAGDAVSYAKKYQMDDAAKTLTIGATAGTFYYGVKATGGDDTKGKVTISIGTTPLAITSTTTATQKAKIIGDAGGNYFKVVVDSTGNATVSYHPAVTDGVPATELNVTVDASGMTETAKVTFSAEADGSTPAGTSMTYAVTGLAYDADAVDSTTSATGATITKKYTPSYEFDTSKVTLGDDPGSGYPQTVNFYVDSSTDGKERTTYSIAKTPAKDHYFQVTYKTKYEVEVVYVNKDGATLYDLASKGISAPIDASGLKGTSVDTLTIDKDGVAYAVTDVPSTVTTINKTEEDTVATMTLGVLADGQSIAIGTEAVAYYAVSGTDATALTLGAKTTTKPDDATNYFKVEKSASTGNYTITYVTAKSGTAYELSSTDSTSTGAKKSTLAIDAANVPGTTWTVAASPVQVPATPATGYTIAIPEDTIVPTVTNVKGGVTVMKADGTTPIAAGTVSYKTAFAWTPGIYYIALESQTSPTTLTWADIAAGATVTTAAKDKVKYIEVTVKKTADGKYSASVAANHGLTDDNTGVLDFSDTGKALAGEELYLTLPSDTKTFDANSTFKFTKIDGVVKDAVLTNVNAATTVTTVSTLASGDAVKISAGTENTAVAYTSGGGAISVLNAKAVSGAFIITKDSPITGNGTGGTAASIASTAGDGKVVVTFTKGATNSTITSVTGLEKGEVLTIGTTTYEIDGSGYVVRSDGAVAYPGATPATADILALGYAASKTIDTVGQFDWTTPATYYLPATTTAATIATSPEKTGDGTMQQGASYIMAVVGASGALTLTPVKANAMKLYDPDTTYAGTITVKADGNKVVLDKAGASYTLAVAGVADDSSFTDLGTADKVETSTSFASGEDITFVVSSGDEKGSYAYKAGATGTLSFVGKKLQSGTVQALVDANTTDTNYTVIQTTDGTVLESTVGNGATVVVTNGSVTKITDLETKNDVLTYTKDGVTYSYKVTSDDGKTVQKTVTAADGATTITTLTRTNAADDILTATETGTVYVSALEWNDADKANTIGYFYNTTDATGEITVDASNDPDLSGGLKTDRVYIKAENVFDNDADPKTNTLTLTPMIAQDGKLVTFTAGTRTIPKVTIAAPSTNTLVYDGTGKTFTAAFTGVTAGSVFTTLRTGDTVTASGLAQDAVIKVNGTEYKALAGGSQFVVYAEDTATSRLVTGTMNVTGTLLAATADGATKTTLTYAKGSEKGKDYDGVQVTFTAGKLTSFKGWEAGEKLTLVSTTSTKRTETVYEASPVDSLTIYKTVTETTLATGAVDKHVYYVTTGGQEGDAVTDASISTEITTTSEQTAFTWTPASPATSSTGWFVLADNATTVAEQTAKTTLDYTSYGKNVLEATYDASTNGLTLTIKKVQVDGVVNTTSAAYTAKDVISVNTGGKAIALTRPATIKSLVITNAGAGTNITGFTSADSITTVALKAASGTTPAESITLAGHTYRAGSNTAMTITNGNATSGVFLLQQASGDSGDTITAFYEDSISKATTKTTVTYTVGTGNVIATVADGIVTKLTGLDGGETATVTTTETQKDGTTSTYTATYAATEITSGAQKGQISVRKTMSDGRIYTHTFANNSSDILSTSVDWAIESQSTTTKFDWAATAKGAVGYFVAEPKSSATKDKDTYQVKADKPVAVQASETVITGASTDKYYVRVTAEKTTTGAKVTNVEFLVLQANGTFAAVTDKTLDTVNITAPTTADVELPEHAFKVLIAGAQKDANYSGLTAGDTVTGTDVSTPSMRFRVNGTVYTPTTTSATPYTVNGDGTIEAGTFTISGTAEASAKPVYDEDTVTKKVTVTGGSASVTFKKNAIETGSEITGVTGIATGATVVVENYKGLDSALNEKTTITEDSGTIKKKIAISGAPTDFEMTKTADSENDLGMKGFTVSNKFDFGATTAGSLGVFSAGTTGTLVTLAAQNAGQTFSTANTLYVLAGAQTDATTKDITINYLQVLKYNGTSEMLDAANTSAIKTNGITLAAPTNGNLTLAEGAVKLRTEYKPVTASDGTVSYVIDEDNSDTKGREYAIKVTAAQAGKTYKGFAVQDTVTFGALALGDTLTVGSTSWKTAKVAATDTTVIRGDGTAQSGVFVMDNSAYKTLVGTVVDAVNGNVVSTVTSTGNSAVQVTFAGGTVTDITGMTGGTVTWETKNEKTGVVTKTVYSVTATGKDTYDVTQTRTVDGVTTTTTGSVGTADDGKSAANVVGSATNDPSASVTANFDWTTATGVGYFLVEGLDTTTKKFTTAEIKAGTTTISKTDAGKYYLKVELSADGVVSGITLMKVNENGTLTADTTTLLNDMEGTISITAPTEKALTFDKTARLGASANSKVAITGAIAKSKIENLAAGDTLTTATLTPSTDATKPETGEYITLTAGAIYAGEAGTMEFVGADTLKKGVVKLGVAVTEKAPASLNTFTISGEDASVATDDLTVMLGGTAPTTPVTVSVADGKVTAISGLTTGGTTLAVADKTTGTNSATYGYDATNKRMTVTVALGVANATMKTVPLEKGTFINSTYFAADKGEISFVNDGALTVRSGVLGFRTTGTVILSGTATGTTDNKSITVTKQAANTSEVVMQIVNGEVKSIKGLGKGESIDILNPADGKHTIYTADSATGTKITKTVGGEAAGVATITYGADILSATYPAAGAEVDLTTDDAYGQLSWAGVDGRSFGYFLMNAKSNVVETITEQATKKAATAKKGASAVFVKANASTDEDNAKRQILTIDAIEVTTDSNSVTKISKTLADTPTLIDNAKITVTAPTAKVGDAVPAIAFDKGTAKYQITINKAAANSTFTALDAGDKVTTAALAQGNLITFDTTNIYKAGAKNATLTFVGEGDNTAATPTNAVRLLAGTIQLDTARTTAILSGAREKDDTGATDDITLTYDDAATTKPGATADEVIVKVANGVATSVTGLVTKGARVIGAPTSGNGTAIVYTVVGISADGKTSMVKREEFTMTNGAMATEASATAYKAIACGKELDSATGYKYGGKTSYTAAVQTTDALLADWTNKGKKFAFVDLTKVATDAGTSAYDTDAAVTVTTTAAKTAGVTSNVETAAFTATPENYFLRVTANTAASGVTTISAVDLMQAAANGKLAVVPTKTANFRGTLTIDGATLASPTNASDGKISFALPKTKTWKLTAQNVAIGSTFTNLADGDKVTSADATDVTLAKGTVTLYHAAQDASAVDVTETTAITYAGKDGAKYDATSGDVAKLSGLATTGEKVTIVRNKALAGEATVVYEVTKKGLQRTRTLANGVQDIRTITASESLDVISAEAEALFDAATPEYKIVSDFDWTMDKASTGYFLVASNAATAKAGKTTITASSKNKDLISVAISADGVVSAIKHVTFNATTGALDDGAAFSGKLTLAAPASKPLVFDRAVLDGTTITAEGTQLTFTGAAANSTFTDLIVGDKVETAALKAETTTTAAQWVTVNGATYRAGANGKIGFTVQDVPMDDGTSTQLTLTSGTIAIYGGGDNLGANAAYVGKTALVKALAEDLSGNALALGTDITVAASTNKSGVTSYTVGALGENESFQIGKVKYLKTPTAILKYVPDTSEAGYTVYTYASTASVASIKSSVLESTSTKTWKTTETVFTGSSDDTMTSKVKFTVDLAKADSRAKSEIAANKKAYNWEAADSTTYNFVVDKYISTATKSGATLAAAIVANFADGWEERLGVVTDTTLTAKWAGRKTYVATDHGTVGQTIKAANLWDVTGTAAADTITGAASGKDTLIGGAGDDSLVGGGAADTFVFSFTGNSGKDVVKGYATGKDSIYITNDASTKAANADKFQVELGAADVLLHDGSETKDNSISLLGMGNGKEVSINGTTYYFGNTKAKAMSMKFTEGAVYYGNAAAATTISVGTDKTKATKTTLGDTVTVDLAQTAQYHEIDAVDASKSGNRVALTASETGSTLKGGTYQSTLKGGQGTDVLQGGSGEDVFWFDNLYGNDTVKGYTSKSDAVYLADNDLEVKIAADDTDQGVTIAAAANNKAIELKTSSNTLLIEGAVGAAKPLRLSLDGTTKNTLSYYVGNNGSGSKKATNNYALVLGTDTQATTEGGIADSMKSYYVGSASANDTVKVTTADKKAIGTSAAHATVSLRDGHMTSIDSIDASSLTKGSYIDLVGGLGNCTLKGSASADSHETFKISYADKTTAANTTVIQNLTAVSDVIELAAGISISGSVQKGNNVIYTLTDGVDTVGSIQVNNVKLANMAAPTKNTAGNYQIRRN